MTTNANSTGETILRGWLRVERRDMLPHLDAALPSARDAALEEARDMAAVVTEPWVRDGSIPTEKVDAVIEAMTEVRRKLRALQSAPAQVVSKAKVREVLKARWCGRDLVAALDALDIPFDAAEETGCEHDQKGGPCDACAPEAP